MNKLIVTLFVGLFASAAFAQAPATVAPAKSAQSDVKAVKPLVKADTASVAAVAQGETVKTAAHHHTAAKTKSKSKSKAHHATHHVTAKKKVPSVQAKTDTKAIAPK